MLDTDSLPLSRFHNTLPVRATPPKVITGRLLAPSTRRLYFHTERCDSKWRLSEQQEKNRKNNFLVGTRVLTRACRYLKRPEWQRERVRVGGRGQNQGARRKLKRRVDGRGTKNNATERRNNVFHVFYFSISD